MSRILESDLCPDEIEYYDLVSKKDDISILFDRVRKLEEASSPLVPPLTAPPENWAKRNAYWFFPIVAVTVALLIGSGFLALVAGSFVDRQIDAKLASPLKQIGDQAALLARMDGRLEGISDLLKLVAENEMKRVGNLRPVDFNKNLPEVKTVFNIARTENIAPPPGFVENVQSRLSTADKSQPGFWGAAAAFVSYSSSKLPSASLPNCTDRPPAMKITEMHKRADGQTDLTHGPLVYSDCRMELDASNAGQVYARTLTIASLEFVRCLIVYRGHTVVIPSMPPPLNRLVGKIEFTDCQFDFSVAKPPTPAGKTLISSLLSSQSLKAVGFILHEDSGE